ncbi:hypothetical protein [Acinetobacter sp. 102]|uniref:hypothetical protein n=1 Tax=Acinetobacter sp. 102 TaxID=3098766 RepID=UPI003008B855
MFKSNEIEESLGDGQYETKYGIHIWSRYDYEDELNEMLAFCRLLSKLDLTAYITKIFYDSKSSVCFIDTFLDDSYDKIDKNQETIVIEEAIKTFALATITQFQLFGRIGHQNLYLHKLITESNF